MSDSVLDTLFSKSPCLSSDEPSDSLAAMLALGPPGFVEDYAVEINELYSEELTNELLSLLIYTLTNTLIVYRTLTGDSHDQIINLCETLLEESTGFNWDFDAV